MLRKLDADRWAHVYPHLISLGGGAEAEESAGSLELLLVCRWLGQGHDSKGTPMGGELATSYG